MNVLKMIENQQRGQEDTTIFMVGEQLKDICRQDPGCAAIVAEDLQNPSMSIAACEQKIKAFADELHSKKKISAVGVSPQAAERIIRKFYGLPDAQVSAAMVPAAVVTEKPKLLDLDDLLGL